VQQPADRPAGGVAVEPGAGTADRRDCLDLGKVNERVKGLVCIFIRLKMGVVE
jgi:hypothetical protein